MKKINGSIYSKSSFDNYKLRIILEIKDNDGIDHKIDIYTTQLDLDQIHFDLVEIMTSKVSSFKIVHHSTKEEDDTNGKFIREFLTNNF